MGSYFPAFLASRDLANLVFALVPSCRVVTKATRRGAKQTKVAMKKIIMHNETDGVSLRPVLTRADQSTSLLLNRS